MTKNDNLRKRHFPINSSGIIWIFCLQCQSVQVAMHKPLKMAGTNQALKSGKTNNSPSPSESTHIKQAFL